MAEVTVRRMVFSGESSMVKATALLYHNVGPTRPGTYPSLVVSPDTFEKQISTLARLGYKGISARQWLAGLRGEEVLPQKPVVLTFDDGYADLAEYAAPVLNRYDFCATIFIVTDLIGDEDAWLRREAKAPQRLLTSEQILDLAAKGFDFGAHSRTHADLTSVSAETVGCELQGSRAALEHLLRVPVETFAYPYGYHNEIVRKYAKSYFALAFTIEEGRNDRDSDPMQLRRTMVQSWDGALRIAFRASCGFEPINTAHHHLARLKSRVLRYAGRKPGGDRVHPQDQPAEQ